MRTAPGVLRVTEHVGLPGLEELTAEWTALARSLPRRWFHHYPEWYAAYLAAPASDAQAVRFFALRQGDTLQAVVPLELTTRDVLRFETRVLSAPKHDHVPFTDVIATPGTDLRAVGRALLAYLQRQLSAAWDLLVFPNVLEDAMAGTLARSLPMAVSRPDARCDFITCAGAASARDIVSKNLRSNLRRTGNKLRREGEVTFEVARTGPALREAFADLLRVEASGWKGPHGTRTAIALDPRLVTFYEELISRFEALGAVEISQLKLSGRCVAAQLALVVDGVWYQLKIGYDDSLASMAPGNLLMEQVLDRLCRESMLEANLVSDESWHRSWNAESYGTSSHFVGNRTLRGLGLVMLLRLRNGIRRLEERRAAARANSATVSLLLSSLPQLLTES